MSLLFQDYHIPMIRAGSKTVTRRESRPNVKVGGVYMAAAPQMVAEDSDRTAMYLRREECDCWVRVDDLYEEPLGEMTDEDARREGDYESLEQFREGWEHINGEGSWDPEKVVWVVPIEYVGRERRHPQRTLEEVA